MTPNRYPGLRIAIGCGSQGLDKRRLVTIFDTESTTLSTISSELGPQTPQNLRDTPHEIVHPPGSGIVLLGILKSVERELLTRELVGDPRQEATPLWFIAETERNVFLWRSGKSLDDRSQFIFWVDIRALLIKRRAQLQRSRGFNPFIHSMLGAGNHNELAAQVERQYIDRVEEMIDSIFTHAETLSHASESIRLELSPDSACRKAIKLPFDLRQTGPRDDE